MTVATKPDAAGNRTPVQGIESEPGFHKQTFCNFVRILQTQFVQRDVLVMFWYQRQHWEVWKERWLSVMFDSKEGKFTFIWMNFYIKSIFVMDPIFLKNKAERKSRKFQFPAKKPPGHLEHLRKHHSPTLMETLFLTSIIIPFFLC